MSLKIMFILLMQPTLPQIVGKSVLQSARVAVTALSGVLSVSTQKRPDKGAEGGGAKMQTTKGRGMRTIVAARIPIIIRKMSFIRASK